MTDPSLYGYSLEDFREEAKELLARAEGIIADIRNSPDREKVNALFRVVHSLKGSAAYAGLDDVNSFSHLYESFLGELRNNGHKVDQGILNILIRARDYLYDLIFHPETIQTVRIDENVGNPLQQLSSILRVRKGEAEGGEDGYARTKERQPDVCSSQPPARITLSTQDPASMDQKDVIKVTITNSVKALHSSLKAASPDREQMSRLLTKLEDSLLWAFSDEDSEAMRAISEMKGLASSDTGPEGTVRLKKAFNRMASAVKEHLGHLDGPKHGEEPAKAEEKRVDKKKAEEIRGASKDDIVRISLNRYLDTLSAFTDEASPDPELIKRVIDRLKDLNRWAFNKDKRVNTALSSMEDLLRRPYPVVAKEMAARSSTLSSLLLTLLEEKEGQKPEAGNLPPVSAMQGAKEIEDTRPAMGHGGREGRLSKPQPAAPAGSTLKVRTEDVEALTSTVSEMAGVDPKNLERLQAHILNLRMVPVGEIFNRFRKIARDLSEELGKEIEIEISGESVKLDKLIADKLNEPLLHMVRNAASHGLEYPDERRKARKRPAGLIRLGAYQEGGHVIIEVSDDGRGISLEEIRKRGEETGLLKHGEDRSEKALLDLIFTPGFSTKQGTDKVSGRGVGMDVVRDVITSVQGTISIETREGVGTTFRLQLPLTLAVIRAMVLELSRYKVAVPSAAVDRAMTMTEEELRKRSFMDKDRLYLNLHEDGEVIPVVNLSRMFSLGDQNKKRCVVLVKAGVGQKAALIVDSALKREPLMVKPLDRFAENRYFSSASFMGNDIILLLNTPSLMAA